MLIKWAQDLNETIYLEEWERVWKSDLKMLRSISLKENYYKIYTDGTFHQQKLQKYFQGQQTFAGNAVGM